MSSPPHRGKPFDFTNYLVNRNSVTISPKKTDINKEDRANADLGTSGNEGVSTKGGFQGTQSTPHPPSPRKPMPVEANDSSKWQSLKHHRGEALVEQVRAAHPSYTEFMVNAVVYQIEQQQAKDEAAQRQAYLDERQRRFELKVARMQAQLKVPSVTNADGAAQSMWRSRVWLMDNAPEALERATAMLSRAVGLVQHERIGFSDNVSAKREEELLRRIADKEQRTAPFAIETPVEHINKARAQESMSWSPKVNERKQAIQTKTAVATMQLLQQSEEGAAEANKRADRRRNDEHERAKRKNQNMLGRLFTIRDDQAATDDEKAQQIAERVRRRDIKRSQRELVEKNSPSNHPPQLPSHQPLFGVGGRSGELGSILVEGNTLTSNYNEASMSLQWSPSGVASRSGTGATGVVSSGRIASPNGGVLSDISSPQRHSRPNLPQNSLPINKPLDLLIAAETIARGKLTHTALSLIRSLAKECAAIGCAMSTSASKGHIMGLRNYNREQRVSKKIDQEIRLAVEKEAQKVQNQKLSLLAANERAAHLRDQTASKVREKNIARQIRAEQVRKERLIPEAVETEETIDMTNADQKIITTRSPHSPRPQIKKHVTVMTTLAPASPLSPRTGREGEVQPHPPSTGQSGTTEDLLAASQAGPINPIVGDLITDINPKIAQMLRKITGFEQLNEAQLEATRAKHDTLEGVTRKVKENQQPKAEAAFVRRVTHRKAEWDQLNAKVTAKSNAPTPQVNYGAMHAISAQLTAKVANKHTPNYSPDDGLRKNENKPCAQSARGPSPQHNSKTEVMAGTTSSARAPKPPPQPPALLIQSPSPSYDPTVEPPPFAFAPKFNSSALPQPFGAAPLRTLSLTEKSFVSNTQSQTTIHSAGPKKKRGESNGSGAEASPLLAKQSPRQTKSILSEPRTSIPNTDLKQLVALEGRSGALGGVVDRTHNHNEHVTTRHQQWREKLKQGADINTFDESKGKVDAAAARKDMNLNERAQVAGIMGSHREVPELSPKELRIRENISKRQERQEQKRARFKLANSELGAGLRDE